MCGFPWETANWTASVFLFRVMLIELNTFYIIWCGKSKLHWYYIFTISLVLQIKVCAFVYHFIADLDFTNRNIVKRNREFYWKFVPWMYTHGGITVFNKTVALKLWVLLYKIHYNYLQSEVTLHTEPPPRISMDETLAGVTWCTDNCSFRFAGTKYLSVKMNLYSWFRISFKCM
jgi:hypothetical protein